VSHANAVLKEKERRGIVKENILLKGEPCGSREQALWGYCVKRKKGTVLKLTLKVKGTFL